MYWSLRNKTEDIDRALAACNTRWARMAALELGVRLSHTSSALRLQAGSMGPEEQADADDQPTEEILFIFEQELERLLDLLKENQAAGASEVVQKLFLLLDALDHKGGQ
ncbi:hypothetical protein NU688_32395 [Variovorax sp. ZS18.2.2]|uniref:hypothetical protein n=1 Tax=Variovorax sp. ZS18.2.2 TaxID=2971255 RepID=UPI002151033A|nr:hypothetical protein [Variovorax sp. ZS18.2.2]MCR6480896.1 hypothetical protein [Variovorax sp. ZS18.2.2]